MCLTQASVKFCERTQETGLTDDIAPSDRISGDRVHAEKLASRVEDFLTARHRYFRLAVVLGLQLQPAVEQ